jgi:hypothetical protein
MIRNDIKTILANSNLDSIFLQHRDIDQDCYRVGIVNDEIICWNPKTNELMDYFYDDQPERKLFSLGLIFKEYGDRYTLNRENMSITGPHGILTIFNKKDSTYPSVHISRRESSGKVISQNRDMHRILALLFIPRYNESYTLVDHIDRDKTNYSLNNLRWVDHKLNNLNQNRKLFFGNNLYTAFSNKDRSEDTILFKLSEKEIYEKYHTTIPNYKNKIKNSIFHNMRFDKIYWKIENLDISNYLREGEIIDESLWVEHFSKKMYIHPLGLIKIKNKQAIDYVTVGSVKGSGTYKIRIFKRLYIHRLVAETFLNGNKPLKSEQIIDHLDGDSLNNRVENLKICTQKENVNNPNYGNKINRKTPIEIDGIKYESYVDAASKLKDLSRSMIRYRVLSDNYPNYKFI